jgi:hypothetical protein
VRGRAEHARQRLLDLLRKAQPSAITGTGITDTGNDARRRLPGALAAIRVVASRTGRKDGLADATAVTALGLTKPPDEMHAATHRAPIEVGGPVEGPLAARADQHLTITAYAAAPRALPAVRVYLPGSTPIAGHPVPICRLPAGSRR